MKHLQRLLAVVLSLSLINIPMIQPAHAGLVSTEQVARLADGEQADSGHARLTAVLSRADVRDAMQRQGVDPALAVERVSALTDDEAGRLAEQINSAPAGGIIGALLLVFFVLLTQALIAAIEAYAFKYRAVSERSL